MWKLVVHRSSFIPKCSSIMGSLKTTTSVISRPSFWHLNKCDLLSTTSTVDSSSSSSPPKGKTHGSYHWIFEKLVTVSLVGLIPAAFMVPHPGIDYALGVLLPFHCHMGFMQVITDYLPKRKFPIFYFISSNGLRLATLLTLYGLYLLNSEDIGITKTVRRLWSL